MSRVTFTKSPRPIEKFIQLECQIVVVIGNANYPAGWSGTPSLRYNC